MDFVCGWVEFARNHWRKEHLLMRKFQNVLYVTRGMANESDAIKQALEVARNDAAALHAVVVSPELPKEMLEYKQAYEASLAGGVAAAIASAQTSLQIDPSQVQVTVEVECGDAPAILMVRRVLRNEHDLLIKMPEPTDRNVGFGSVDMQLLRTCPCPVWLCRPVSRARTDVRVAVAVDPQSAEPAGRDLALSLLLVARSLADTCNGELIVVSCWDFEFEEYLRHQPWFKLSNAALDTDVAVAQRDHLVALDALIQESGIEGRVRVHHTRGRPDRAIPQIVDALGVDILVMGTVARTGIPGLVIGNTAENVLREIRCSLLAVKPHGFVSPVRAY
jgi:universal stress protein E